jgi:hypothetical protein
MLIIQMYSLLIWNQFKRNSDNSLQHLLPLAKGQPVLLLTTPSPKKVFPKKFNKDCSLCCKQGHISVDCNLCPENAHKKTGYKASDNALSAAPKASVVVFAIRQDTLKHYASRNAIWQPRKMRWFMLCY